MKENDIPLIDLKKNKIHVSYTLILPAKCFFFSHQIIKILCVPTLPEKKLFFVLTKAVKQ